jgi:hypothetical protein
VAFSANNLHLTHQIAPLEPASPILTSLMSSEWHIIRARIDSAAGCYETASATEEAAMLKPLLFVSTVVLFGITALSTPGSISQDTTPAPAAGQKNPVKPTE